MLEFAQINYQVTSRVALRITCRGAEQLLHQLGRLLGIGCRLLVEEFLQTWFFSGVCFGRGNRREIVKLLNNVGNVHSAQGRFDEAKESFVNGSSTRT